ncbi:hypothetical protein G9A89_003800 [Geosiphon pyriformis]|nr:hypothetical protein G9A89_003800 [Geosiphon pyriformis]
MPYNSWWYDRRISLKLPGFDLGVIFEKRGSSRLQYILGANLATCVGFSTVIFKKMAAQMPNSHINISELKEAAIVKVDPSYKIKTWLKSTKSLLDQAENAKIKQDLNTLYVTSLKVASIILEVVPHHKDFNHMTEDISYDYFELKRKIPGVLEDAEEVAKLLEERDNKHEQLIKMDGAARNTEEIIDLKMPVPHPTPPNSTKISVSNNNDPRFPPLDTSNTLLGIEPSPVYIFGESMIGSVTSNSSSKNNSQTMGPLNSSIAQRIANLRNDGLVAQSISGSKTSIDKNYRKNDPKNIESVVSLKKPSTSELSTNQSLVNPISHPPDPIKASRAPDPLEGFPVTNTIKATELEKFLKIEKNAPKILILDIRNREPFQNGHIKAENIICLEPLILIDGISSIDLEHRLILSPQNEQKLFSDRHTFDLIVYHDQDSVHNPNITSARNSNSVPSNKLGDNKYPMYNLVQAIWVNEFQKPPKRPPVLLVGGFEGWKRLTGDAGIENAVSKTSIIGVREPLPQHDKTKRNGILISDNRNWTGSLQKPNNIDNPSQQVANFQQQGVIRTPYATNYMDLFLHPTGSEMQSMTQANYNQPSYTQQYNNNQNFPAGYSTENNHTAKLITPSQESSPHNTDIGSSGQAPSTLPEPPVATQSNVSLQRRRTFIDHPFNSFTRINNPEYAPPRPQRPPPPPPPKKPLPDPTLPSSNSNSLTQNKVPLPSIVPSPLLKEDNDMFRRPSMSLGPNHQRFPPSESSFSQLGSGIGTTGLKNLGNTCFMNSVIQCLSGTIPFSRYFLNGSYRRHINTVNPLGTKGLLSNSFAKLLHYMWSEQYTFVSPVSFKEAIGRFAPQFSGSDQQDSQEFLAFLLDGLHEDLNVPKYKPPIRELTEKEEEQRELLPPQKVSEIEWENYTLRNWSIVVSLFQGQFRNRLECMTCGKTSTTYNTFMYLSLPIPTKNRNYNPIGLHDCLNEFVREEILDGEDAWQCPRCQTRRRTVKRLTLSRLPDILLIHLKRFSFKGPFRDKLETVVDFPLRSLDLTHYMLPPLAPTAEIGLKMQLNLNDQSSTRTLAPKRGPPYLYDLYAVSNHYGGLNGGHYTACVRNGYRQEWHNFDDSRVSVCDERNVMTRAAYSLFYVRTSIP